VLFFPVLFACTDQELGTFNTSPEVTILSPASGQVFDPGSLVELIGAVIDTQDAEPDIEVSWSSNLDGVLGSDPPDDGGDVYLALNTLQEGAHVVTLTAIDTAGDAASVAVDFTVGEAATTTPGTTTAPVGTAPTVVLAGPSTGDVFTEGSEISFVGKVTDEEQSWETLQVSLTSTRDGTFWEGTPEEDGRIDVPWSLLQAGAHTVSLDAVDDDGNIGADAVDIEVVADDRPVAQITSHVDGDLIFNDISTTLQGLVTDAETAPDELAFSWSTDLAGELAAGTADGKGSAISVVDLPTGTQVLTLTAIDTDGQVGSHDISITAVHPDDYDDDGDGWTENEGDCDDTEAKVYPDAAEQCDDLDNDCDGEINEDWADGYEDNDDVSTAPALGEFDESLGTCNSTGGASGLTLHTATDEDWLTWSVDDEIWDDVCAEVTVSGLPSSGLYTAELYVYESGAWTLKDDVTGSTSLYLYQTGDWTDDSEDDWAVRIYAVTWPSGSCSTPYTVDIGS